MHGLQAHHKEKSFMMKLKSYPITGLTKFLRLHQFKTPKISRQLAHEEGKVVIRPYPLGNIPGNHLC
jgi:hypothetical protein